MLLLGCDTVQNKIERTHVSMLDSALVSCHSLTLAIRTYAQRHQSLHQLIKFRNIRVMRGSRISQ